MIEGDIIRYNLEPYNFNVEPNEYNNIITLRVVKVCCEKHIIVTPLDGSWPRPFNNWELEEKLITDYIIDTMYTIEPKTPPR